MTSPKRGVFQFLGVACLIVGGLFAILSLPFFWQQIQVLRSWGVRQAQVLASKVIVEPSAKHEQLYAARLRIVYVVDGRPVTVELTSFESSSYEETVRRTDEFPVGSRHAIRYDPHNPTQARIGAGWNRRFFAAPLITLGCGVSFAVLAAGFFIAGRMMRPPGQAGAS